MGQLNAEVTHFLNEQEHPLRDIIDYLRKKVLSSDKSLTENIKWKGPNYCINEQDCITMRIYPPKQVQLVLHRGAKKQKSLPKKMITFESEVLQWKENDRAVISFKSLPEAKEHSIDLTKILKEWIRATKG